MSTASLPHDEPKPAVWHVTPAPVRAAGIVGGLVATLAVLFLAFGWPAAHSQPHRLPVGVAAPLTAGEVQAQLDQVAAGGFVVTGYPDQQTLRAAIRDRTVSGGLASSPPGLTLLTATGGSPAVAQLLTRIGAGIADHSGAPLHTEDLAPLPAQDPRGAGLAASALPLTLAGLLPAIVLVLVFPGAVWLRFWSTVGFSVLAAATIAVLLRYVFGSVDHNLAGVTAGLTLGTLAMSLSVLGLGSLFGRAGLGVGAAIAVLLGNPLSGLMSAPQLLPAGLGTLGQWLPQGANATLLRSTAYFFGAGAGTAIPVLTGWVVAGVLLVAIAGLRNRAGRHA